MNKVLNLLILPFLCWGAFSCQSSENSGKKDAAIVKSDSCLSHPAHSYEVFIPPIERAQKDLPLLVLIDPHGDGKLAINQFINAATKYPIVLVASNLVRNNDPNYTNELEELIDDVIEKYPVNETIFMCGFSGGARMAIHYARNHSLNGIIACGALADESQISAIKCPIMAITGMDDFNFMEAAQYVLNPENIPINVLVEITKASHAWPEQKILSDALGYFQLSVSNIPRAVIKKYAVQQKARIDSLKKVGDWIQAELIARNMALVKEFSSFVYFGDISVELRNKEEYRKQQKQLLKSLQLEMKVRQAYLQAFEDKDAIWWKTEISSLNDKIVHETNSIQKSAYQRIKAFLGIVCYSNCNKFVTQNNISRLEQTILVYEMVEPENKDIKNFVKVLNQLKDAN